MEPKADKVLITLIKKGDALLQEAHKFFEGVYIGANVLYPVDTQEILPRILKWEMDSMQALKLIQLEPKACFRFKNLARPTELPTVKEDENATEREINERIKGLTRQISFLTSLLGDAKRPEVCPIELRETDGAVFIKGRPVGGISTATQQFKYLKLIIGVYPKGIGYSQLIEKINPYNDKVKNPKGRAALCSDLKRRLKDECPKAAKLIEHRNGAARIAA